MIPTTLDECFSVLDAMLGEEDRKFLQDSTDPDDAAIQLHHSLGMHLRNEWGLWKNSELTQFLQKDHGIKHPDDMSHFILVSYCRARIPTVWDRLNESD